MYAPRRSAHGRKMPVVLGVCTLSVCLLNICLLATQFEPQRVRLAQPPLEEDLPAPEEEEEIVFEPPSPPRLRIGVPVADIVHVCIATDLMEVDGVYVVVNSTLFHASEEATFFFHLIAPAELHVRLIGLQTIFPRVA